MPLIDIRSTGGGGGAVTDVNGQTGSVVLTAANVGAQPALGFTPEDVANKDIDGLLAADSDILYPSQKAVKTYADAKVADAIADGVTAISPSQNAVFDALGLKQNIGNNVKHVGPGREYTTIQSALTAIGNAASYADNIAPQTVIVDGGVYDEDLVIPSGRIISLLSNGTIILGDGLGSNWSSSNVRNITWDNIGALSFGANPPRPAFLMGVLVPSDATSTFIAQAGSWRVSGGLVLGGDGISHTLALHSVEINGACSKTDAGLMNVHAYRSYFKGAVNWSAGATVLSRIDHCQFDNLITVDGYNEIRNSEIKAGLTMLLNYATLPPSGMFNTTFAGVFTGPVGSLKLDGVTNYFFITKGATLGGAATKVILEYVPASNVTDLPVNVTYPYTLIAGDITAKQITLPGTPVSPLEVTMNVIEGIQQDEGSDFTVSGAVLSWNGLGYESLAAIGDQIIIKYKV
jgi:hypothetical protein